MKQLKNSELTQICGGNTQGLDDLLKPITNPGLPDPTDPGFIEPLPIVVPVAPVIF